MGYVKWERKNTIIMMVGISYICSYSTAPPSRITILQIQASEFNLKIAFTFTTAVASLVPVRTRVRAMRSLNHFRTEVIGKHPAEGWCRKCNTPSPLNASATSVSTRANVLKKQGQGLHRRNRAGKTIEDTL